MNSPCSFYKITLNALLSALLSLPCILFAQAETKPQPLDILVAINPQIPGAPQLSATNATAKPTLEIATAQQPPAESFATPTSEPAGEDKDANAKSPCDLPNDSRDGLAVFSGILPPPHNYAFTYKLKKKGDVLDRSISLNYRDVRNSDFDGVDGKIYILKLREGTYEFTDWNYGIEISTLRDFPKGLSPLTFDVEKGRAIYLGGFEPSIFKGKNFVHETVYSAWVLVQDDQKRDLPVFFKRCPAFDPKMLDVKVMDTTPWLQKKK
jgi:hypothetical protein